jgi:SAM-dependent methyltransferase
LEDGPVTNGNSIDFRILDVGCGVKPKGDVNIDFFRGGPNPQTGDQIRGEFMSSKEIRNFIIADAMHLPFRDESFYTVFSSHTIEHVQNPLLMLREMCRVAKRKVIVRCPHRKGSGAVMPYHINYLDEEWFKKASDITGFKSNQFTTVYDYPISSRIRKIFPKRLQTTLFWRALVRFERAKFMQSFQPPLEMEVWLRKKHNLADSEEVKLVIVYSKPRFSRDSFSSSPYTSLEGVTVYHNISNEPPPRSYNRIVQEHLQENVWFVFCHQNFILKEDLRPRLKGKEVEAVYGPIGTRLSENRLSGMVIQPNGTSIGRQLREDTPVQTLDEMCLIVHSEVFRQELSFDERFRFNFYGADFCMQAYASGFDVIAMQLKCKHQGRTFQRDITSQEYLSSLNIFKEKWKQFLPIRTTTKLIT